jgi:zinc and cadmium transporter
MIYALIVSALSLAGAALPLRRKPTHAQLQVYLSLAAGTLLGAALFHMLPESSELIHTSFGLPAVIGVAVVFLLQRYLAPHSHEPPSSAATSKPHAEGSHNHGHGHETCEHGHEHRHGHSHDLGHHAMPATGSVVGVIALSIHSFFDGVAIGAVCGEGTSGYATLAVFLSVLIHKPMDGLSVSVLLMNAGVERRKLWVVQIVYALLVPAGAITFLQTSGVLADAHTLIGYTLAFSGGSFLAIALTDLLPEIQFHSHDRHKLTAAVGLGLVIMWVTSIFGHPEGHSHGAPAGSDVLNEQPADEHDHHDHSDHNH